MGQLSLETFLLTFIFITSVKSYNDTNSTGSEIPIKWHLDQGHDPAGGVVRVSGDGPKAEVLADPIVDMGTVIPITTRKILTHPNYKFVSQIHECGHPSQWDTSINHDGEQEQEPYPDQPHHDPNSTQTQIPLDHTKDANVENDRTKRIVGGKAAKSDQYPWMAQLYLVNLTTAEHYFQCGGTLISSKTILTAAHCLTRLPPGTALDLVVLGLADTRDVQFCNSSDMNENCSRNYILDIEDVEIHRAYNEGDLEHDLGLIYLKTPVKITEHVRPVCLPYGTSLLKNWNSLKLTSAGWGSTERSFPGPSSVIMKQVDVDLQPRSLCDKFHTRTYGRMMEDRICVGGNIGRNTCNGDSGGGFYKTLPIPNLEKTRDLTMLRVFQFGIVSAGGHSIDTCGFQGRPTAATSVLFHMEWILNHIVLEAKSYYYENNEEWLEVIEDKKHISHQENDKGQMDSQESQYRSEISTGKSVDVSHHPKILSLPVFKDCGNWHIPFDLPIERQGSATSSEAEQKERPKRIVGGIPVKVENYMPWMAQVYVKNVEDDTPSLRCSGTIISSTHIITAAHCVSEIPSPFVFDSIVVGQYSRDTKVECINGICYEAVFPKVSDIIIHGEFEKFTQKNNIALIRLHTPLNFSRMIQPICLPRKERQLEALPQQHYFTAGWGRVFREGSITDKYSAILLNTYIDLTPRSNCDFVYSRAIGLLGRSRFCGQGKPSRGECFGDGGSPLMKRLVSDTGNVHKDKVFQIGLVSFTDCGMEGMPTVYTNIIYYMNWILDNLDD